jgi:hypothetical protein
MRDFFAVILAITLAVFALSMATSLKWHRKSYINLRQKIRRQGQSIIAEIPGNKGLNFFTADEASFYWAGQTIQKDLIKAAHVLISGAPISTSRSKRFSSQISRNFEIPENQPNNFGRDRWDVAVEMADRDIVVECGAIREHVSQDLAREIFEAIRSEIISLDKNKLSS